MQAPDAQLGGSRAKRRGKRAELTADGQGDEERLLTSPLGGSMAPRSGRGGAGATVPRSTKDIVHHHPPKEIATDIGYPVRGGQTLLIAYFPWEASEADVEREFAKFSRVKRVHLVVDKSSRKPRCFGFVKFMSKVDAEEAILATAQGLVQLPDARGHVWHLKAEWTKSGDMVVDDSETEQEVAKRKEERRSRADRRSADGSSAAVADAADHSPPPRPKSGSWPAPAAKGSLHPGVPAPLPPLQPRCPASSASFGSRGPAPSAALGLQGPIPVAQGGHAQLGAGGGAQAPHPAHQGQAPQLLPAHQQAYGGQQGQRPHAGTAPSPSAYGGLGGAAAQLCRESGAPVQPRGQAYPPPAQGYAAQPQSFVPGQQGHGSYGAAPQGYAAGHAYAAQQPGYAPHSHGYASQQQGGGCGPAATGYPAQAYAGYAMGQSLAQQGAYGYAQQPGGAAASSGVLAFGGYPAGPASGAAVQTQVLLHPHDDGGQEPGALTITSVPHVVVGPPAQPSFLPASASRSGPACSSQPSQRAAADVAPALPHRSAGVVTPPGTALLHAAAPPGAEASYHDMVWQLSEMSLHEKAASAVHQLAAPLPQPPPAHSTRRNNVWEAMQHAVAAHGLPGASWPSAAWNSFDDVAAKGLVDGLVGHEDGANPLVSTWSSRVA
mmetsp:Transcript_56731/g.178073  ORF Transcript_56731/g.178073 Transcript_56731/m.178073 type:complete len:662 (+) Transcript_56731:123-2108(+)